MTPIVQVRNLEYKFESDSAFTLSVEALDVWPGATAFLWGSSGSGKTTLLNILAGGVDRGNACRIEAARLFYLMHGSTLLPWTTVRGHLSIEGRLRHIAPNFTLFEKLACDVDLPRDILELGCHTLSLGMRQRVEIVKAISFCADLILADEPFAGIDGPTRTKVLEILLGFVRDSRCAMLLSSHSTLDVSGE